MRGLLVAVGLALTILVGSAAALEARSAASFDFGDAPDGAPARYAGKPDVVGSFPTKAASGGPRHTAAGPRLGRGWSAESDSRQVDRDADDGASLVPRSCATSTLTVVLDIARVAAGTPVYVNAWFDWNQDGDWADGAGGACGAEWGVQNYRVDPSRLEEKLVTLELRFRGGHVPDDFWWRVQVHAGSPAPHAAGGRQTTAAPGETEDRLYSRPRAIATERVGFTCSPAAGVMPHGGARQLTGWVGGSLGRAISIVKVDATLLGDKDGLVLGAPRLLPPPLRGVTVELRSTRQHDRTPVSQSARVQLDVKVVNEGRLQDYRRTCAVTVWHSARIFPPFIGQQTKTPAITTPATPTPSIPIEHPTPESARCRASLRLPGRTTAAVQVRCDGAHPKSWSVSAGSTDQRIVKFSQGKTMSCYTVNDHRALRCRTPQPSKGILWGTGYVVDKPFGSTVIHVLAGGFGVDGTAIVLIQNWFVYPDGRLECRQSVPRADKCATL